MKFSFSKSKIVGMLALVLLMCLTLAGCGNLTDEHNQKVLAQFAGNYAYKNCTDNLTNLAFDYSQGGNLTLAIENGKAVIKNENPTAKLTDGGFVFNLDAIASGNALKIIGDGGYYYAPVMDGDVQKVENGKPVFKIERADYVFGSATLEQASTKTNVVIKLMFANYASTTNDVTTPTQLVCALTVTFEK